jgi:hypothetical protein
MTNFVNVRMPEGLMLDPQLKPVVDKLAIGNPKWVFAPPKGASEHARGISYSSNTSQPVAPEGFNFVRVIDVTQDTEFLGKVYLDSYYGRNTTQQWRFNVKCWRVSKERGNRDTVSTTKADVVVRQIKKLFKAKDYTEIMRHAKTAMFSEFTDAVRTLRDPIRAMRLVKSPVSLQAYAMAKALDEPIVSPDLIEVERSLQSDSFKQSMAEYFLAEDMAHIHDTNKLWAVVALGNNQYLYEDDTAHLVVKYFDDMPERMQTSVSVLQLMQDNEIVRDVGYRYNDRHFYVMV